MKHVSVILVNWKRPEELRKVIRDLERYEFIDDINVWDNRVNNVQVYGRWLGAKMCKHDIIYTQDDDCLIDGIQKLYDQFDGEHLSNGLKPDALLSYKDRNHTLVGWGAFFNKDWVDLLDRWTDLYPPDHILYTNADRIMTALFPKPYMTLPVGVTDFDVATNADAMASQPSFLEDTAQAMERLKTIL